MDANKKPFKMIPLHKARNIEKTMRGKFVNNFSSNLNSKKKEPILNLKSEKNNNNFLNPLKDFIDQISFDINMGGNRSDENVITDQLKSNLQNENNNNDVLVNEGRVVFSNNNNKNGLFVTKHEKENALNYKKEFDLPRILPINSKQDYNPVINQNNYTEEETIMINKILADKLTKNKLNEFNNKSNSNVVRIEKFPELRKKNLYSKNRNKDKLSLFPFNYNLNKELGRISNIFGKESSMKYFSENPKTEYYFNRSPNYKIYKNFKVIADKKLIKPRLLPLKVLRETSYDKLSGSFFNLHKNVNDWKTTN